MKQKGFQKFISVLLALVLTLGLALPAMAADGSGEQGSKLSFEQVSADEWWPCWTSIWKNRAIRPRPV